jgi:hypothetical protein
MVPAGNRLRAQALVAVGLDGLDADQGFSRSQARAAR